jgi:uncharacterized protein involved in exopolysaccharide biosynthesis
MQPDTEISLKDIYLKLLEYKKYIVSKWKTILISCIIGAILGLAYSFIKKPTYTATTTFVLDDGNKSGGLSQYAGLAAIAGINMGGGGGGLFQAENIIQLYTSRTMIVKTLLAHTVISNKETLIINSYIEFNGLLDKWNKKAETKNVNFIGDPKKFTRTQDSILSDICDKINNSNLVVSIPDKKTSIIMVEVNAKDELFAKSFGETLVENVNSFYIQTKTKKAIDNLNILKRQADSVRLILNTALSGVASSIDAAPNANPYQLTLRVPSQKKQIDVSANTAIYAEVVKNMEIAKMSLLQDKPLIQIIDQPILPLKKAELGKVKGLVIGVMLLGFLTIILLIGSKFLKSVLN